MRRASLRHAMATGLIIALTSCSAADETLPLPPTAGAVADYQLGGSYPPAAEVQIVTRDRTAKPDPERYSICYVNGFQTQPDELDDWLDDHAELLLRDPAGELVADADWPDEMLLDISTPELRQAAAAIVSGWIAGCADDGYDAVEIDNLDSWTRSDGALTHDDAIAFARLLVDAAHQANIAIGQKNAAEVDGSELGFDFAVTEECAVYDECDDYTAMYGPAVIEIEYTDNGESAFADACAEAAGTRSIMLRDRDLVPVGDPDYVFEYC